MSGMRRNCQCVLYNVSPPPLFISITRCKILSFASLSATNLISARLERFVTIRREQSLSILNSFSINSGISSLARNYFHGRYTQIYMNRGINSNDSARRYQPKFLLLTLLAYHTCNTSKRENREFLARVVIVAEQVSRIISPVAQIWPGRYAAPERRRGGSCRITISAVIKPVGLCTCMHTSPPLLPWQTRFTRRGARSVHRTDVPAARAARTEPGAARAPREERVAAGSASGVDAPGDGAACSGPSRAGSSGCTSAPLGARKLGPRRV